MNTILKLLVLSWASLAIGTLSSCQKYLDAKPDAKLATPATLNDLQLMLDDYANINGARYPAVSEVLADNYYLSDQDWASLYNEADRNNYRWLKDDTDPTGEYAGAYRVVYISNVVLDQLLKIGFTRAEQAAFNNIRGSALFIRAAFHYAIAQLYAVPFDAETAQTDLGIPLKLSSDYTEPISRSSVADTYGHIIADLTEAAELLPEVPLAKSRPSKPAAYGWLARTYLAMGDFANAKRYADSCLLHYDSLMNFNDLNPALVAPISRFNNEVVFQARSNLSAVLLSSIARVTPELYASYDNNDLRKVVYFRENADGTHVFKGDYDGIGTNSGFVFAGIVTDELYLTRAECLARLGDLQGAADDLNKLLRTRWREDTYTPRSWDTSQEAVSTILSERRKSLLGRGSRWTDLRRLRKEPEYYSAPIRMIDGQTYTLEATSPRFTLAIPDEVIRMSNIPQNP